MRWYFPFGQRQLQRDSRSEWYPCFRFLQHTMQSGCRRFRPYEGARLEDMVESVKAHVVRNPVIVQKPDTERYEMLAGHNRLHAAEPVGLKPIPAPVRENLTGEEALAYVIKASLMQRSFSDMLPSEQAAVLAVRHEKLRYQGRRKKMRNNTMWIVVHVSQQNV